MTERISVHPTHPQNRLIDRAAAVLRDGGLLLIPTDAGYDFAWGLEAVKAEDRVIRLRALDRRHPFTLICAGLSDVGSLSRLDNQAFRLIKGLIPGPITFILPTSSSLPKRLKQAKRRAIGCRVPDHAVAQALIAAHGAPLLVSSVVLPEESPDSHDPEAVAERLLHGVDLMLDADICPMGPTTVIDMSGETPQLIREGAQALDLTI
ncbi:MAG: L-threonylcarbamoyladenylate synthase [Lysobacteraceae bacterium]